jgi:hypothetical protein
MNREPVYLDMAQRQHAVDAFVESLLKRDIPVRVCAIDRIHLHLQAPFPDHNPRHWVGVAKKESSHALKLAGIGFEGGIWAVRCKCLPIENARHEFKSIDYIVDHAKRGAVVWIAPYIADWLQEMRHPSMRRV